MGSIKNPQRNLFSGVGNRDYTKADPEKKETVPPFLSKLEREQFNLLRAGGNFSRLRVLFCKTCKAEIPDSKEFCSSKCFGLFRSKERPEHDNGLP